MPIIDREISRLTDDPCWMDGTYFRLYLFSVLFLLEAKSQMKIWGEKSLIIILFS